MFSKKGSFFLIILAIAAGTGLTVFAVRAQNQPTDETVNINAHDATPMLLDEPPSPPQPANANVPVRSGVTGRMQGNLPNLINGLVGTVQNQLPRILSGKVAAIDGTTITIKVDGKDVASGLIVGDSVVLMGTPKGLGVKADENNSGTAPDTGNASGVPGIGNINQPPDDRGILNGKVTAANGASLIVQDNKGVDYKVDASQAKIYKVGNKNATSADVLAGDRVAIRGVVNGTTVTASMVTDLAPIQSAVDQVKTEIKTNGVKSFLGKIGDFFNNIFNKNK
jgi:hypothetical protein